MLLICHCWTGLNLVCITLGKSCFFLKKANTPPDKLLKEEHLFSRTFPEETQAYAMFSWIKTQKEIFCKGTGNVEKGNRMDLL